jgi:hypothetical protein
MAHAEHRLGDYIIQQECIEVLKPSNGFFHVTVMIVNDLLESLLENKAFAKTLPKATYQSRYSRCCLCQVELVT